MIFYEKWMILYYATKQLPVEYKTFLTISKISWLKIWKIACTFL